MNKAIYFKGSNCSVCSELYPKIKGLFEEKYPNLEFETIEVEKAPEISAQYGVFTIPVLIVLFEGKEHLRFVRNFSAFEVDAKLQRPYQLMFG